MSWADMCCCFLPIILKVINHYKSNKKKSLDKNIFVRFVAVYTLYYNCNSGLSWWNAFWKYFIFFCRFIWEGTYFILYLCYTSEGKKLDNKDCAHACMTLFYYNARNIFLITYIYIFLLCTRHLEEYISNYFQSESIAFNLIALLSLWK